MSSRSIYGSLVLGVDKGWKWWVVDPKHDTKAQTLYQSTVRGCPNIDVACFLAFHFKLEVRGWVSY